ncbi:MAG: hypothetical protein HZA81_02270 [Candidatus Taylorbacteria bacterium]|nr:hypothetical protein [Candidatus Taylorbacteria bacterium]
MKTTVTVILLALVIAGICRAETTITTGVLSKYVTNAAVYHDKPVWQTTIEGTFSERFSWSIFNSTDMKEPGSKTSFGNEFDYTISFEESFGEHKAYTLGIDVSYWDLTELFKTTPADVIVGTARISRSLNDRWTATLSVDRLVSTDRNVFEGGTYVTLGFETSVPLGERASLSVKPSLIRDDGAFGLGAVWIGQADLSLDWKAGKASVSFPSASLAKVVSGDSFGRKSGVVWGGNVSFSF